MSLKIQRICLDNFRGYEHLCIDDLANLTIIVGPNAVGKTNIIEAVQLLTSGVSFRKPAWSETISWGMDKAHISISLEDGKRRVEHSLRIEGNERTYEVNGKRKSAASIRGTLPCVLFIPDDLQLVKAASSQRRECIDALGAQLSKNYSSLKASYQQALRQRNLLIKDEIHEGPLFESWNESLAIHGARLCLNRWRLFDRLADHMKRIYGQIVHGETLDAVYMPSWERFDETARQRRDLIGFESFGRGEEESLDRLEETILEYSRKLAAAELRRGVSLVGPHKDEIVFFINGKNARLFASQGQQRTIVLSLKLAAVELVNEMIDIEPVLLLDDVMSELDENHRDAFANFVQQNAQTIVTTTNIKYFSDELIEHARVIQVPIENTRYEYRQ